MPDSNSAAPEIVANPAIEVGARAIVEPQGVGDKFSARFLGWEMDRFVALTPPADLDLRDQLYSGKLVIVRYLRSDGQVVGFESAVQGIIYKPQKILFINYPAAAQAVSLRKRNRVDCFLPATLMGDGEEINGTVVNISSGGCLFIVRPGEDSAIKSLREGAEVFLVSRLFAIEADLHLNCKIMNIKPNTLKTALGIGFFNLEPEVEELLDRYVAEVSTYLGLSCANPGL